MRRLLAAFLIFLTIGCAGQPKVQARKAATNIEIVETVADDGGPIDIQASDPPLPPTTAELGADVGEAAVVVADETGILDGLFERIFESTFGALISMLEGL